MNTGWMVFTWGKGRGYACTMQIPRSQTLPDHIRILPAEDDEDDLVLVRDSILEASGQFFELKELINFFIILCFYYIIYV